jgi:hypothetical protein
MITLPAPFANVPDCPGYFWHTINHTMYSIKIAGELRELKRHKVNRWTFKGKRRPNFVVTGQEYYQLSVKGTPRLRYVSKLKKLKCVDYEIPVHIRKETI